MELLDAIRRGDLAGVRALLDQDPALAGARTDGGPSPVLTAAYGEHVEMLAVLLARSPALDLFEAAAVGDVERTRALVRTGQGAVRERSGDGWTALHLAAFFGHGPVVDVLLASGAEASARSENRLASTALHAALAGRGDMRIVSTLLARGADVRAAAAGGYTPLHLAAGRGDPALLETLLARGADAMARAEDGRRPLDMAEARGHQRVARRLRGEMP